MIPKKLIPACEDEKSAFIKILFVPKNLQHESVILSETVGGMDADVEPTGMYLQRVAEKMTEFIPPELNCHKLNTKN